ncbi:MAG: alpha/beta hydrolase [Sphingopyxis sp.]|nr:alpha/beta hydrolase [Sphingopyxis sp.]
MPDAPRPATSDIRGIWRAAGLALAALGFALSAAATETTVEPDCRVGAYRLQDGDVIDIATSTVGALRWRNLDGTSGKLIETGGVWASSAGWTDQDDGLQVRFGDCASGTMQFGERAAGRIPLETRETSFNSHDTRLVGRLILPPGNGPVPIVVLLHGAEPDSARDTNSLQRMLPAAGVGAFVYDKRGTGASGDKYTQDFPLLADDAVAALAEARRMAGARGARFGFQGPSQGGWIAPLAATPTNVDFLIVSFGLAVSVADEDREAIAFQMGLKGYAPEIIAKAQEIGAAATRIFESGMAEGINELDVVRARYRNEPWYKDVYGNYTHVILGMTADEIRTKGQAYNFGTPVRYDPMPTLRTVTVPQLWALGGQDIDAPVGETVRRIGALIKGGKPITLAVFPKAEHGMTEFDTAPDGTRISTRYTPGYFRLLIDYAKGGKLATTYGDAEITLPAAKN